MTPPKAVRHLTPEELAERYGPKVSVETLKRWRRIRYGPHFLYIGRHVYYRERDVEAWEKANLVTTAA